MSDGGGNATISQPISLPGAAPVDPEGNLNDSTLPAGSGSADGFDAVQSRVHSGWYRQFFNPNLKKKIDRHLLYY